MFTRMQSIARRKRCSRCKRSKFAEDFPVSRARPDGRYAYCRACCSVLRRECVARDPDSFRTKNREAMREWRKAQKPEADRRRELRRAREFWERVEIGELEVCWAWVGHRTQEGYGVLHRKQRNRPAHRVAWLLSYGAEPSGVVMHKCDNRACCNPLHLQDGTPLENTLDMVSKGRAWSFGNRVVLEPEKVQRLRELSADGWTGRAIAAEMGVSTATVSRVLSRQRWAHVPDT